ncbi:uncharacterized protein LOC123537512 isoform X1 [Mercenaria mercenaria]|uniref:uncharacterized protein LOC123537512 isoform X1 n=1 Tax=Mercenaria mercenaria TaxID=6596 RepID=UPI00234EBC4B|nr:uncharacterized protein LOC123537512 isoform X1 [Mercenaria mercenaria]
MPKQYTEDQLKLALSAVRQKKMKIKTAARLYNVPKSTLFDKVKGTYIGKQRGPARQLLPDEEESLVQYLLYMANQGFPLTRAMMRCYIQEIVLHSGRETLFNIQKGPSDDWFVKFFSRHPNLAQRKPENMDKARVSMSSKKMLDEFFPFLEGVLDKYGIRDKPHRIFNCDETGFTGKEAPRAKVIGPRGGHLFRRKTVSADHVTAHLCVSADGHFLPPAIIYKGSLPHQHYKDSVPSSWHFGHSENGYMDRDLFHKWFVNVFVPNCGRERPVILVMDNHDSHISIAVIEKAISEGIVLLGLPGHSTHILQPLDVNIISPLKDAYTKVAAGLGYINTAVSVGKAKFPVVLKHAMDKIAPATIVNGFAKTGICPFSPSVIDTSQIVEPTFRDDANGGPDEPEVRTCGTCGSYITNPLVRRGLISNSLANILVPPPTKPQNKQQKRTRVVAEGRLISGNDMLSQLKEKEELAEKKKSESEKRKTEMEMKRKLKEEDDRMKKIKRMKEKEEREARKLKDKEMKSIRKQKKKEEQERKQKEKVDLKRKRLFTEEQIMSASMYVCGDCKEKGRPDDEINGILWFGCDEETCGLWFHEHCLTQQAKEYLWESLENGEEWFCHRCKPWLYEE